MVSYLARKKLLEEVHYFVHLNLALSLLLGYVVFMLGMELGTSSKVRKVVCASCMVFGAYTVDVNCEWLVLLSLLTQHVTDTFTTIQGWLCICGSTAAISVLVCLLLDDV